MACPGHAKGNSFHDLLPTFTDANEGPHVVYGREERDPSPAQIAQRMAAIRAEWTEEQHRQRAGQDIDGAVYYDDPVRVGV